MAGPSSAPKPEPESRRSLLVAVALSLLVASLFWSPAFRDLRATGFGDWQNFHHTWELGYVALTRFGEWPLWNPFFCGGISSFGNPESQHFSPFFPLSLLLGTTLALKVFLVLHATVGLWGMYLFARRALGLRPAAAALAGLAWGCSGFFAWHGAGGHSSFLPFYLAPWLLLAWRRAEPDPEYAVATAALLALTLMEGGTYPFPYFVLLLALDTLLRLGSLEAGKRMLRAGLITLPFTLLLGAIRILPVRDALARMPRTTLSDDALQLPEVITMLTARDHGWRNPPHHFVWPEYGTFVGYGVLGFALLGVLVALRRKHFWVVISLAAFVLLMLGERGPLYPWPLLHRLPVFDSLRVPSRFAVLVTFYLALCAALALDRFAAWLASRRTGRALAVVLRALPWLVVALLGVDLFYVNLRTIDRWDGPPISDKAPSPRFYFLGTNAWGDLYASLPALNLGIRGCYAGAMNWVISPVLWNGDVPQVRFSMGGGQLLDFSHTINTVHAHVLVKRPMRMIVNQNFDPDFRSSVGQVVADRDRLAVDLPAGEHRVVLRYAPRTLPLSLACAGLGWPAAVGCALWLRRRRRHAPG